jgi:lysozyme family protein
MTELVGKDAIIARTIDTIEGGFVNNPDDVGGPTNMGITLATLRVYKPNASINDIRNMTKQEAIDIYTKAYWTKYYIDTMPVDIQDVAFDSFVQYNPHTATKLIQEAINRVAGKDLVVADGMMGVHTLAAFNIVDAKLLRTEILAVRKQHYLDRVASDPSQEQFLAGWMNRLKELA